MKKKMVKAHLAVSALMVSGCFDVCLASSPYTSDEILSYRHRNIASDQLAQMVSFSHPTPISTVLHEIGSAQHKEKIKVLYMGGCSLDAKTVPVVVQMCEKLPQLEVLVLKDNLLGATRNVEDSGLEEGALKILKITHLKYFDVTENGSVSSPEFITALFKKLEDSQKRKIIFCSRDDINEFKGLSTEDMALIKRTHAAYEKSIRAIEETLFTRMSYSEAWKESAFNSREFSHVQSLYPVEGESLTSEQKQALVTSETFTNLRTLSLCGQGVDDTFIRSLCSNPCFSRIISLDLSDNPEITRVSLELILASAALGSIRDMQQISGRYDLPSSEVYIKVGGTAVTKEDIEWFNENPRFDFSIFYRHPVTGEQSSLFSDDDRSEAIKWLKVTF